MACRQRALYVKFVCIGSTLGTLVGNEYKVLRIVVMMLLEYGKELNCGSPFGILLLKS